MRIIHGHRIVLLSAVFLSGVFGDFSGPSFLAPRDLTSDRSLVRTAWNSLTDVLEASGLGGTNISNNTNLPNASRLPDSAQNITFSIGLFSLEDPNAVSLQFHHTSPEIAASPQGTKNVDGNSIYRIASVTKVFTVLAGLLTLSDAEWERPLDDILAPLSGQGNQDNALSTSWHTITPRALAAQLGGVPRDGFPNLGELALQLVLTNTSEAALMARTGLPPANITDPLSNPPCLTYILLGQDCPSIPYISGVANRAPTFPSWTTPGYSNNGFTLLGLALSALTNRTIHQLYQSQILTPLKMTSTFSDPPPTSLFPRSVIVNDPIAGGFAVPNGIFVSSGGVFSTVSDLARFGTGILNSSLLAPERTRRWLKPVSHTARLEYDVGAPWEIVRSVDSVSGKVTDLYTKSGDSGLFSSWFVLVPEYGFGFTVLTAGSSPGRSALVAGLTDLLTDTLLPALRRQAEAEAGRRFAGVYKAEGGLNSSMVLATSTSAADAAPGLVVSSWVSNGTDVLPFLANIMGPGPFRLLPSVDDGAYGQVAFRLVGSRDAPASPGRAGGGEGLFSAPGMTSGDWLVVDSSTYYGMGLSLLVFDLGKDGKACAVEVPAYRVTLKKAARTC